MPRTAHTQPISPRLYRHFALVTIFVTISVAILADGRSNAAIEDAIAQRRAENSVRKAEQEKLGAKKVGALRDARKVNSGSGFGSDTRLPDDNDVGSVPGQTGYTTGQPTRVAASFPNELPPLVPPGLSPEVLRPPEAARRTVRKGPTAEDRRRLEEMSRLRSGVDED